MFEVRFARGPGASGESTLTVAHLDEMAKQGARPVAFCRVGVVAVVQRNLIDVDAVPAAAGKRENPGPVPAIGSRSGVVGGKVPSVGWGFRRGSCGFRYLS
jgi:hypothetical protein